MRCFFVPLKIRVYYVISNHFGKHLVGGGITKQKTIFNKNTFFFFNFLQSKIIFNIIDMVYYTISNPHSVFLHDSFQN